MIEDDGDDEISQLGTYFNQMTTQLKGQRDELLEANRKTEGRRRLFDSVLGSVTSGVVGLNETGRIDFANRSAQRLLAVSEEQEHAALAVAVPEFGPLFNRMKSEGLSVAQDQVNLVRDGQQESLLVRMSPRRNDRGKLEGYVVAFDDVTDLVSAQRMAAWGDVARRIAHEIKNPLTPIQLSAERIKRKFSKEVTLDVDDTMISQALTNLIKNAGEATEACIQKHAPEDYKPEVRVEMDVNNMAVTITIADNGIGLPADRARLFEPYVTTRDSGTGLGLPIVKKIIEEHGGVLTLTDAPDFHGDGHCGAAAIIQLPTGQTAAVTKTTD